MRKAIGPMLLLAGALATTGCSWTKKTTKALEPMAPKKPVPPGTVLFTFTQKVAGPLDLVLDGVRVPVVQGKKPGTQLVVTGLAPGKHKYFLSSPIEAFGFDQGDFEVFKDKGTFLPLFSTRFKSVLYGQPEPVPPAEGIPGVTARLLP